MKNLTTLLGGLSAEQFLRDYWQKKPLLIRQAIPNFNGLLNRDELISQQYVTERIKNRGGQQVGLAAFALGLNALWIETTGLGARLQRMRWAGLRSP